MSREGEWKPNGDPGASAEKSAGSPAPRLAPGRLRASGRGWPGSKGWGGSRLKTAWTLHRGGQDRVTGLARAQWAWQAAGTLPGTYGALTGCSRLERRRPVGRLTCCS